MREAFSYFQVFLLPEAIIGILPCFIYFALDVDLWAFRGSKKKKKPNIVWISPSGIIHGWITRRPTLDCTFLKPPREGNDRWDLTLFACTAATFPPRSSMLVMSKVEEVRPGAHCRSLGGSAQTLPPCTLKHKPTLLYLNRNKDYFDRSSGNNPILQPLGWPQGRTSYGAVGPKSHQQKETAANTFIDGKKLSTKITRQENLLSFDPFHRANKMRNNFLTLTNTLHKGREYTMGRMEVW